MKRRVARLEGKRPMTIAEFKNGYPEAKELTEKLQGW